MSYYIFKIAANICKYAEESVILMALERFTTDKRYSEYLIYTYKSAGVTNLLQLMTVNDALAFTLEIILTEIKKQNNEQKS